MLRLAVAKADLPRYLEIVGRSRSAKSAVICLRSASSAASAVGVRPSLPG
jgi:hypothetical protein